MPSDSYGRKSLFALAAPEGFSIMGEAWNQAKVGARLHFHPQAGHSEGAEGLNPQSPPQCCISCSKAASQSVHSLPKQHYWMVTKCSGP